MDASARSRATGRTAGRPRPRRAGVPVLESPFPSQLNPHAAGAEATALRWAARVGLVRQQAVPALARQRFGRLAGRAHPDLGLPALADICRWYLWFAVVDDQYCDRPPPGTGDEWLAERLADIARAVLPGSGRPPDPAARAAADVAARTRRWATDEQYERLVRSLHTTFFGLLWETSVRRAARPVRVTDYVIMRRYSGALPAFLTMAEIYGGRPPEPEEQAGPLVADLVTRLGNLIMWQNDIRSYPAEVGSERPVLSLPTVLARERGLPPAAALRVAARMWREEVVAYRRARAVLLDGGSPAIVRYADRLHLLLAGFLTWSYETPRYS